MGITFRLMTDMVIIPDDTRFSKLHFPVPASARLGEYDVELLSILIFFLSYISGNVGAYY